MRASEGWSVVGEQAGPALPQSVARAGELGTRRPPAFSSNVHAAVVALKPWGARAHVPLDPSVKQILPTRASPCLRCFWDLPPAL